MVILLCVCLHDTVNDEANGKTLQLKKLYLHFGQFFLVGEKKIKVWFNLYEYALLIFFKSAFNYTVIMNVKSSSTIRYIF